MPSASESDTLYLYEQRIRRERRYYTLLSVVLLTFVMSFATVAVYNFAVKDREIDSLLRFKEAVSLSSTLEARQRELEARITELEVKVESQNNSLRSLEAVLQTQADLIKGIVRKEGSK